MTSQPTGREPIAPDSSMVARARPCDRKSSPKIEFRRLLTHGTIEQTSDDGAQPKSLSNAAEVRNDFINLLHGTATGLSRRRFSRMGAMRLKGCECLSPLS